MGKDKQGKKPKSKPLPGSFKRPVVRSEAPAGKQPRGIPDPDRSQELMAWRLSALDLDGPWGSDKLNAATMRTIHDKMCWFESMTANEVFGPNVGHKRIPVESLRPDAQQRLQQIERDDVDELWELRLWGAPRLWGFRQGNVFHALWWDPDHTVCGGGR